MFSAWSRYLNKSVSPFGKLMEVVSQATIGPHKSPTKGVSSPFPCQSNEIIVLSSQ